jgi:hypothetical protein
MIVSTASLTMSISPVATAVYEVTQPSTSQAGAPHLFAHHGPTNLGARGNS